MRKTTLLFTILAVIFLLLTTSVYADVPHMIRFQGKVTDKAGAPLGGRYDITFRIYDHETGGTLKWSETQVEVPVYNGIFTALLGNVNPIDLPFNEPYWLSMEINDDGEMEPRQRITSVGYAYYAEKAKSIDNVSVVPQGAIILWRGTSCPEGYSAVNDLQGKFLVAGKEGEYNPAAGGSNTHNHGGTTGSHTLTISEIPSHNHAGFGENNSNWPLGITGSPNNQGSNGGIDFDNYYFNTTYTGGGEGHNHSISIVDNRPEFAIIILCEKD